MLKALLTFALTRRPLVILGLVVLVAGGLVAFSRLNIEAYPNPAPVILEITAQAPGLSAEEMERYYTIPMEIGLATTPGVDVIRSTSFYGLSFVRVAFNYGVDYYLAYTQAAINLQQRVALPNNVQATIQGSSLVGEIFRYQLVGPPHFGLTNLRTLQDWVVQRRLLAVPGVVQVVTWGGTTKTYDVEINLHRLDAYNITLQQALAAIGNANLNVGGRTINLGQQSVNIRGLGLIQRIEDIENIVLTSQPGGIPVLVKDVAKVSIGYLPRLGKAGRDGEDDVVTGIVIMHRTQKTNEVLDRVEAEVEKINGDNPRISLRAITISALCSHFERCELAQGNTWRSYSTKKCYAGYLKRWIVPQWGKYELRNVKAIEVESWLRRLPLAKSSCAKIRGRDVRSIQPCLPT